MFIWYLKWPRPADTYLSAHYICGHNKCIRLIIIWKISAPAAAAGHDAYYHFVYSLRASNKITINMREECV